MTHSYLISGMTCAACRAKVDAALRGVAGVTHVQLGTPEVSGATSVNITMAQHVSTPTLAAAVAAAGAYVLADASEPMSALGPAPSPPAATSEQASFWVTYKPLLLVVGFVLAGTLLRELLSAPLPGRWSPHAMMDNFMGGFFIAFAFFKLLDLTGFAAAFFSYDLLARRWFGYGYVYPFLELILGGLLLAGIWPVAVNAAVFVVMTVGNLGVWQSLRERRTIRCACLGTVFNLPMSSVTLVENGSMAFMAALSLIWAL